MPFLRNREDIVRNREDKIRNREDTPFCNALKFNKLQRRKNPVNIYKCL